MASSTLPPGPHAPFRNPHLKPASHCQVPEQDVGTRVLSQLSSSLAVTATDDPFQGPQHPQDHPSLGNPGAHPVILAPAIENQGSGVSLGVLRSLGTQVIKSPLHIAWNHLQKNSWLPSGHEAPQFSHLSSNLAPCPKRGAEAPKTSIWRWRGVLTSTLPPKLKPPFPAHQPQPPCPGNQATCVQRQSWERGSRRLKINFAEERE